MTAVFLDSGAFIAFLDRSDALHREARGMFASPPPAWTTSALVVAETHGWFLHRLGENAARRFLACLDDLRELTVVDADAKLRRATRTKLDALRGHKLTYVDAASLAVIDAHGIGTVWGTDRHLALEGARVVPGPA